MDIKFIKKIFFIGPRPKELRTMLSLTPNAHKALTELATFTGETIQGVIYDAIEVYLAEAQKAGVLSAPDAVNDEQAV